MRSERRRSTGQDAALTGVALVLVLLSLIALGPLIEGSAWWWMCAAIVGATMLVALGLRALRVPAVLVPVLELGVLLVLLTVFFGGRTAILGFVPSLDTFARFGELAGEAGQSIQSQAPPATAEPGILYVLALGAGVVAVATDIVVVSIRLPALAAVPVAIPLVVPMFILGDTGGFAVVLVVAAVYLLLLWVDVRVRRADQVRSREPDEPRVIGPKRPPVAASVGGALGLAGIGLLSAAVLAASLPDLPRSAFAGSGTGAAFGSGVNAFVDLGRDLRRPSARPVLHYTTEDGSRPYFSLMTLDRFEGTVWSPSASDLDTGNTVDEIPPPPGLGSQVATEESEVRVWVDRLDSQWLPVPGPASSVAGLDGEWYWDGETRNIRSDDANADDQTYRVTRVTVAPSSEQLREASRAVPEAYRRYLELPGDLPPVIAETVAGVTADAPSPYDAATELQAFLRGPSFTYSTDAPVEAGYDGGSLDVIATFLEQRSGYCVHFASAMAVMARSIGIPARIALGYMPGESSGRSIDGELRRDIDTHDLHTWPELYFEGIGWLPFEPTPGRGVVPGYSRVDTGPMPSSAPSPSEAPAPAPSSSPETNRPDGGMTDALTGGTDDPVAKSVATSARISGIVLGVLLLLLLPALLRLVIRLRRRATVRAGARGAAAAAWLELRDGAIDQGEPWDETTTMRAFAARVAARPGFRGDDGREAAAALDRLLLVAERASYGPSAARVPRPEDLELVLEGIRVGVPYPRRLVADLLPRSLGRSLRLPTRLRTSG